MATRNNATMSHDHTPDSLFDSFTQPGTASASRSRSRSYARPSTSPTSHAPRPDPILGHEHELAAGEETLERMMDQGGRTRRDREQRARTRKRARGERDDARTRGNVDTEGDDGDDLDELFEIPRPRTRTASSSKGSKSDKTNKKKAGKGGKPRMTPYQDDPSLDLSLDPGSDSNTSANSDDEDGIREPPDDGYGTEGSGQDEGDLETQIFSSIGLFPLTSSIQDADDRIEGHHHHNHLRTMTTSINTNVDIRRKLKSDPRQREPGWKGPLESSALKHGPQRGMFDFPLSPDVEYIPNPDYQTLHELAQHTLASTAFLYAGGPYAAGPPASLSLSGMGAGMGSDVKGIGTFRGAGGGGTGAGGWGVKGARGKFGVGILPRDG